MPIYYYKGVDRQGDHITGSMYAEDEVALDTRLRACGVWVVHSTTQSEETEVKPGGKHFRLFGVSASARRRALIDFCTMMYFQTKAGVPLALALEAFAAYYEGSHFRDVVAGIQNRLESGSQFHEALARYPNYFPPEIVGIMKVGESSGNLPETFHNLKGYLEWVHKVISDTRQATLYPTIVFSIISVFVFFLFTAVVPKFAALLEKLNLELPLLTQIVFAFSKALRSSWYVWLLGVIAVVVTVKQLHARSPQFVRVWDQMKLKLPIFGDLNYMLCMSRFAHNLLVLYRAGIPLLSALEMCEGLVGNRVIAEGILGVRRAVERGDSLTKSMENNQVFPPMLLRMVHIGETTGNLEGSLADVADFYAQTVPARIKKMLTVMEPLMMVGLIFLVLIVALAIYQPLVELVGSAKAT